MIPIRDNIRRQHFPVMTWLLIALNVAAWLYELRIVRRAPENVDSFIYQFGVVPARFTRPDWAAWVGFPPGGKLAFLTSMFLHGGWLHLLGNMWTLRLFGDDVEDRMGPLRFLIFYLLCGFAAMGVHVLTNPDSMVPVLGASGAIAGVMGAYYLMFRQARIVLIVPPFFWLFEIPALLYLAFWFFSQVGSGTLSAARGGDAGGVAWWAHVGGFIAGMATFWLFVRRDRWRADDPGYVPARGA